MAPGVTLVPPVVLGPEVALAPDVYLGPYAVLGTGCRLASEPWSARASSGSACSGSGTRVHGCALAQRYGCRLRVPWCRRS